ncbi:hypothetical protein PPSIR1_33279 [Plesiocystis pacifica SIR-1]|uniref:Uncharacterized protein n=1 Tax=Plesiocystis pacifica SIR-1 TaxID=391625 RepID=A6G6L2_9BACT|nr:hypothetical protein [Plesiocystis pacifica]EDM78489.1 hypothetical protein PPSIR1_33279 [Plesiocystis pacifica SIR-1]
MVPADLVVTDDSIYAAAWFDERGLIARYSFDGQAQWTQELALDPTSKPEAMAWSADGFLMVLVRSSLFGTEQTLVQYSPDGEVLTTGALDDPSILVTDFLEVDGVILATGRRTIDDLHYGWLGVLDADGSVLETRFTHDREGTFLRLAIDGSGQPVVAGLVEPDPDEIIPHTGWVQALELDGTPRWSMNPFNIAADVAGTPDGVLVQATTSNSVRELMAVDPQGNVQWSRPYSFVSDGTPLGLNVDAVGHPVVTLLAYGDPQEGAPTLHKLDADGSDLWSEEEPGGELYDVPVAQDFVPETRAIVTLTQRGTFGNTGRVLLRLRNR